MLLRASPMDISHPVNRLQVNEQVKELRDMQSIFTLNEMGFFNYIKN